MSFLNRLAKSKRLEAFVASAFAIYVRFSFKTTRWHRDGHNALSEDLETHGSVIVICWHQRLMYSALAWQATETPIAGLHSTSRAGRLAGKIQAKLGMIPIAMHDKRSNRSTSMEAARLIKGGTSLGLAADGPIGPARTLNRATLEWARLTGKPIWLHTFSVRRAWLWKTWDKTMFPIPFSRGCLAYKKCSINVPRRMDDEQKVVLAQAIALELDTLTQDVDASVGRAN